jgi:hypothetical protein
LVLEVGEAQEKRGEASAHLHCGALAPCGGAEKVGKDAAAKDQADNARGDAPVAQEDAFENEVVASGCIRTPAEVNPDNEDPCDGEAKNQLWMSKAQLRDALEAPQKQGT